MISVHETEKLSLQEIEKFLLAAQEVRFEASQREEVYGWIERLLCQQEYVRQWRGRGAFCGGNFRSTARQSSSAWPRSPTGIGTTCAETRAIASNARTIRRRGPAPWPLASAVDPILAADQAIGGWIQCTRATRRMARECFTSTRSMRSRNGRLRPPSSASRKPIWNRCWSR